MSFKVDDAVNLLNIQYSVCFSVVFAHQFVGPSPTSSLTFKVPGSPTVWASALLLTVYFFLDWVTVNTLRLRQEIGDSGDRVSLLRLLLLSIWIWFLGVVVTLGRTSDDSRLLVLSVYAISASAYHTWNYVTGWYPSASGTEFFGTMSGITLLAVASSLFLRWCFQSSTPVSDVVVSRLFITAVVCLVFTKVLHLLFLSTKGQVREAR